MRNILTILFLSILVFVSCSKDEHSEAEGKAIDGKERAEVLKNNEKLAPEKRFEKHIDSLCDLLEKEVDREDAEGFVDVYLSYLEDNGADLIYLYADFIVDVMYEKNARSRTARVSDIAHYVFDVMEDKEDFIKKMTDNKRFLKRLGREFEDKFDFTGGPRGAQEFFGQYFDMDELEDLSRELGKRGREFERMFEDSGRSSSDYPRSDLRDLGWNEDQMWVFCSDFFVFEMNAEECDCVVDIIANKYGYDYYGFHMFSEQKEYDEYLGDEYLRIMRDVNDRCAYGEGW